MGPWVKLRESIPDEGPDIWYSNAFKEVLEKHLAIIKKNSDQVAVEPNMAAVYRNDFYGYMKYRGVAPQHWFATMRATGLRSPQEFGPEVQVLFLPAPTYLEKLRHQYQTILRV